MKTVCKLTDENDQTYGGCQWGEGVEHEALGGGELCGPGWLHCYSSPEIAVFLNPIHGHYNPETYHLWECEAWGETKHDGPLKSGYTNMRTARRIDPPMPTTNQRVAFGIYAALDVCKEKGFIKWAEAWLSGEDRSVEAARAAWAAAWAAAGAAEWAATRAAEAAGAAEAAEAATWAARAAEAVIDLQSIAEKALQFEVDE